MHYFLFGKKICIDGKRIKRFASSKKATSFASRKGCKDGNSWTNLSDNTRRIDLDAMAKNAQLTTQSLGLRHKGMFINLKNLAINTING